MDFYSERKLINMKGCFIRVSSDRKTGGFIAKTLKLCRAVKEFDYLNRIVVRFIFFLCRSLDICCNRLRSNSGSKNKSLSCRHLCYFVKCVIIFLTVKVGCSCF